LNVGHGNDGRAFFAARIHNLARQNNYSHVARGDMVAYYTKVGGQLAVAKVECSGKRLMI
jgi:hypothetical protein